MSKSHGGANRQREFFPRSKRPTILIDPDHRLVHLADTLDWTEMEQRARRHWEPGSRHWEPETSQRYGAVAE